MSESEAADAYASNHNTKSPDAALPPPSSSIEPRSQSPEATTENPFGSDDSFIAFDFSDAEVGEGEEEEESGSAEGPDSRPNADADQQRQTRKQKTGVLSKIASSLKINSRGKKRKRGEMDDGEMVALWTIDRDYSKEAVVSVWLHKEILDFVDFISPDAAEVQARAAAVARIQSCVKGLWLDATVCVFGSYATNLYLPDSDIDLVIISDKGTYTSKSNLYQLANALKAARIAINVEVIAKARVPIIKFTDRESGINIDVSFEKYGGVVAADTILHWVAERPGLRELVMVVKYFLAIRELNSVPKGGLGGFAVVCLVLSFYQMHPKISSGDILPESNLGVLLIQFFELYGKHFNYDRVGISVTEPGSYFDKNRNYRLQSRGKYSLAIEDPNENTNNISRGTYNLRNIRRAFGGAYDLLTTQCYEMDAISRRQWKNKSLLAPLLVNDNLQR
ncbi:hypothetical protein BZA70DRAFT_22263 [Myxozyma melibiosi]|uniref:polynucleotide adenylyltransferase n=1 Tax=Myxozyma melibiosi TaxID=54550 RepID=A0ABR1FCX3_9ASCO